MFPRSLSIDETFKYIDFLTGKMQSSYLFEKCLYNALHIIWSPVALGVDMKSVLGISDHTIKLQIKCVKFLSLVLGTLIYMTAGRYRYFSYVRWSLFFSTIILFLSASFYLLKSRITIEFYLLQVFFSIASTAVFILISSINKKNFASTLFMLLVSIILVCNLIYL